MLRGLCYIAYRLQRKTEDGGKVDSKKNKKKEWKGSCRPRVCVCVCVCVCKCVCLSVEEEQLTGGGLRT